ncbi:MAG TPA: OsmC family protein [Miltoncostaeaceae bacterium]|nr:OsmC family protein [Miltoncostaeaceae bacterium]
MPAFEVAIPLRMVPGSGSLDREADLPPDGATIRFGMHGPVAEHYRSAPKDPQPSTLDYLVASIGGCLIGTFAGSLLRARVPVSPDALSGTATGTVTPDEDGVLVLRRVHVAYVLRLDEEHRGAAEEVHAVHARRCPNARSVAPAITIATDLEIVAPVAA